MQRELTSLSKIVEKPEHPCVYVMGGAKADDSLRNQQVRVGQWSRRLRACRRSDFTAVFGG